MRGVCSSLENSTSFLPPAHPSLPTRNTLYRDIRFIKTSPTKRRSLYIDSIPTLHLDTQVPSSKIDTHLDLIEYKYTLWRQVFCIVQLIGKRDYFETQIIDILPRTPQSPEDQLNCMKPVSELYLCYTNLELCIKLR